MARRADFMAFPFKQTDLMRHADMKLNELMDAAVFHCTTVPPFVGSMVGVIAEHAWFVNALRRNNVAIANSRKDILPGRVALCGLQNPPQDANVGALRKLGILFLTLAYQGETVFGGGFASSAPLLPYGIRLIQEMGREGMILDLSHANHRTAREALEHIKLYGGPKVCVTHSGCHAVYDHPRNLPDDVLLRVVELGGVVGIPVLGFMLDAADDSLGGFYRHLNHAIELLGEDHVVIGSDDVYQYLGPDEDRKLFELMKAKIDPNGDFRSRYPSHPDELNCPDKLCQLRLRLEIAGFDARLIEKVIGGNLIRFLEESLP